MFRTHLLVQQARNPSFHITTVWPTPGFSQTVLSHEVFFKFLPVFPFFQSLWLPAQPSAVKQYWPHTATAKAKALNSVLQRKNNNKSFSAPPTARAVSHSVLCPDTSLLLCLHTGAVTPPQKSHRHVAEQITECSKPEKMQTIYCPTMPGQGELILCRKWSKD